MKAHIDLALCEGYANCVVEADRVFDIDEGTGQAVVLLADIPAELAEDARRARESCPVQAIRLDG
ncbi:ferredoxin [Amycolatopsis rhabdoformis]|uniref:Ferredoxin n=1 Tax=Amycolatopsis rhabdoformis TaxID=1448059 RepID=A0ABZ1HXK5_9PSEU|nr:ferredoxin [Amycolatopsis rhabdoformis]WSE26313.1 ferredoxin [Amycolatopsis rhabdoformis]